jgi:hypothetical protein
MIKQEPPKWECVDIVALMALAPLRGPYVPWSQGSLRPAAVVSVINEIQLMARQRVVELGSGSSTLYFARAMREMAGTLVSIEHDARWANYIRELISAERLSEFAEVVHVPLAAHRRRRVQPPWTLPDRWYDRRRLLTACPPEIDCLIVDGPPGRQGRYVLAREPAIPIMQQRLAEGHSVALDDATREPEREIVRRWGRLLGRDFVEVERLGLAILRSEGGFIPTL